MDCKGKFRVKDRKGERKKEDIAVISSNSVFELVRIEKQDMSHICLRLIDYSNVTAAVLSREMYEDTYIIAIYLAFDQKLRHIEITRQDGAAICEFQRETG